MLWVDKQRPKSLSKLDYHPELTDRLINISQSPNIPHLLFYGPSGAGKKTRVMALMRQIFGPGVEKVKVEYRTFKTPSGKAIELTTLGSSHHIEMNPSDAGNNDRYVVQEVIKEIAQYHPVVANNTGGDGGFFGGKKSTSSSGNAQNTEVGAQKGINYKVVFLSDCDSLTKAAQHGLRRTMEKYIKTCRLILCCENLSKVIEPLRSRCLCLRVPAPQREEISAIITHVAAKENFKVSAEMASAVASASKRNLRRALLMIEAQRVNLDDTQMQTSAGNIKIKLPDWEVYINELATEITKNQSPQTLLKARAYLYELLGNCIPATLIIRTLVNCLSTKLEDETRHKVLHWAAYYEHRMCKGDKDIYHLEGFVAKFMVIYREYILETFGF